MNPEQGGALTVSAPAKNEAQRRMIPVITSWREPS